ncbi:MAG: hypothetical protein H7Y20_13110 [Bryobacteraceae bacterium]|nr:hypothetical protein [Bryobacteraceae bacterium]
MAVDSNQPIQNSENTNPPLPLSERKCFVQFDRRNTIVVPHDSEHHEHARWYPVINDPSEDSLPSITRGNDVQYFVDGYEAYKAFETEIGQTCGNRDFIYLAGWWLGLDTPFPSGKTAAQLLSAAANLGVRLRLLITRWSVFPLMSKIIETVDHLNRIQPNCAILDAEHPFLGTQHQKLLIVRRQGRLTAFCGGIDINPDRMLPDATNKGPLHDTHCQINGPGAHDVLTTFCERWDVQMRLLQAMLMEGRALSGLIESPEGGLVSPDKLEPASSVPVPASTGRMHVGAGRTFGSRAWKPDNSPEPERSVFKMLASALSAARRFVYIEDQYLVDLKVASLLRRSLETIQHLIILIPTDELTSDYPQISLRRRNFLEEVRSGGQGHKLHAFCLDKTAERCGLYVHSKLAIIDDDFAIVGSANFNRRGMTHDGEFVAGIFDPSVDFKLTYTYAHRLRVRLWGHHLAMEDQDGYAELADGVASAIHWVRLPSSARVRPYRIAQAEDVEAPWWLGPGKGIYDRGRDFLWDHALDPDGT